MSWDDVVAMGGFDLVEYFSGVGRIAKLAHYSGYVSRGFDINYDDPPDEESKHTGLPRRSAFDMNGEAGFVYLDSALGSLLKMFYYLVIFGAIGYPRD